MMKAKGFNECVSYNTGEIKSKSAEDQACMKEKKMHPDCWTDGIYNKVVPAHVRDSQKFVMLNKDTAVMCNTGYEHFIIVSQKSGFNMNALLDDMAAITQCLESTKTYSFAQSSAKSWLVGNLMHLGAFRFSMKLNTPMKEIDANEKKGLLKLIVAKMA